MIIIYYKYFSQVSTVINEAMRNSQYATDKNKIIYNQAAAI